MLTLGSVGVIVFAIYMTMLMAIGVVAARQQRTSEAHVANLTVL